MKRYFLLLVFLSAASRIFAGVFDYSACPDLTAKIFYINKHQAVFYVSADSYTHSGSGFDKIEVRNKFFEHKYLTHLTLETTTGKPAVLRLAIPLAMEQKYTDHVFMLGTREAGMFKKSYTISPLQVKKMEHGTLVFKSYTDSDPKKCLNTLKINMYDNSAALSSKPDRKFRVIWYPNALVLEGLPKGRDTFYLDYTTFKAHYHVSDGGVTVLKYPVGSFLKIFPVYEKFYLSGIE